MRSFRLALTVSLFVATNTQADYALHGVMNPGCREVVRSGAGTKPVKPVTRLVPSYGRPHSTVYMNLAQALSKSPEFISIQDSRLSDSRSVEGRVPTTKYTSGTVPLDKGDKPSFDPPPVSPVIRFINW